MNFLMDMGERPEGLEIERINNDGNYEPGNCRWANRSEQMQNCRKTIPVENFTSLSVAGRTLGIHLSTIRSRRRAGLQMLGKKGLGFTFKLTGEDATEIRKMYSEMQDLPNERAALIAAKFGIKKSTVWNICARRIWKKVP